MTSKVAPLPTIMEEGKEEEGDMVTILGGGSRIDDPVRGAGWRGEGDGVEGAVKGLGIPWRPCRRRCRGRRLVVGC